MNSQEVNQLVPVAWMAWDDAHSRNVFATGEVEKARTIGYNWTPLYSAATVERLVQERDANAAYFEAYHQLRVAVNAAYPQDPYQLAEDVPALMQQQLTAMTQERDMFEKVSDIRLNELAASQAREQRLRELIPQRIPNGFVSFGKHYAEQEDKFADPYNTMSKFKKTYLANCEAALSLPQDDTALHQCQAKLLREMAGAPHCKGNLFVRDELRRKADELEGEK